MTELRDDVLDEAGQRSKYLTARELLSLVERHHPHEGAGVDRETFEAYAEGVADRTARSTDEFTGPLSDGLTTSDRWGGGEAVYDLGDDRISVYPRHWHETLGGVTDPREHLQFLLGEVDDYGKSVPESTLLHLVTVVGGVGYDEAKATLETLREEGAVVEDADQHPDANVYLSEEDAGLADDKDVQ
ncbi:hypothetical protein [Halomarina litorea]|uniref:hypothetical protein n=1 Tax=Halomarina litorea TaxID=2961595 RepID=UPI0020C35B70|nr:hypothetical protein [Halomarina sp. BCD28]